MQRLEKKRRLPPLSFLLRVGMRVIRLQNGEYQHERTARELLQEAKKLAKRGLRVSDPERAADSVLATSLFINGGIRGFIATLEIDKNPINAALSGFAAQKQLEESLAHDSSIVDAWLGLGLFSCALAKAPLLVRGALAMIGKEVSLSKGQNCLRRSAYHGRYTNDIAKLYLIQFLSPYWGHEAVEKKRIFRALQRDYPANPLYLFLELEEDLCFHPKALFRFAYKSRVRKQTAAFKTDNYETRRYAELVKWQYLLIDPFPFQGMIPDPSFDLRGFSYYPVFLRALREKYVYKREGGEKANDRMRRLKYIRAHALEATRTLETTLSMSASRKSFFLWHIQDALGLPGESAAGNK
ncbi:MAG: hypothetical protein JW768_07370 [Chitinispirillaceae bacterium]|nr:hypothetical protein [Chitinispirillaceae bacterium]